MDDATPVEPRTKEPFSMDDQSSVPSNITYQASFDERSEVDSAASTPRDSPDARKRQESRFDEQRSEISRRISTSERQYESVEVSYSVRESVNLMSTLRDIDRGQSRSLRPGVSAETRARWAMLICGFFSRRYRAGDQNRQRETTREGWTDIEVSGEANRLDVSLTTRSEIRPLHLGEDAGHDASVERYWQKLEQNTHIDHYRGFQEGLQVARTLSKRSRSRQRDGNMSRDIGTEKRMQSRARDGNQEIRGQGSVHRMQEGEQEARGCCQERSSMSRDQSLISNSERAFRGDAVKYGGDAERTINQDRRT